MITFFHDFHKFKICIGYLVWLNHSAGFFHKELQLTLPFGKFTVYLSSKLGSRKGHDHAPSGKAVLWSDSPTGHVLLTSTPAFQLRGTCKHFSWSSDGTIQNTSCLFIILTLYTLRGIWPLPIKKNRLI